MGHGFSRRCLNILIFAAAGVYVVSLENSTTKFKRNIPSENSNYPAFTQRLPLYHASTTQTAPIAQNTFQKEKISTEYIRTKNDSSASFHYVKKTRKVTQRHLRSEPQAQFLPQSDFIETNGRSSPRRPSGSLSFLSSDQKESFERILNGSFINLASTENPGQISATDPYIDRATPSHILAYTGKSAILPCFINNLGQRSVSWVRHRDIHVLTVGRVTFTSDGRFHTHHEDGSNEWALRLTSPSLKDSGFYECQVNTKPIISKLVKLEVLEPHAVISGPKDLYIKFGSTLALNCKVIDVATRSDFLLWYHDQKVINYQKSKITINTTVQENQTTSVLRLESAKESDSGHYICHPSNALEDSVNVHVITGEHPAAMQTNSSFDPQGSAWKIVLLLQTILACYIRKDLPFLPAR